MKWLIGAIISGVIGSSVVFFHTLETKIVFRRQFKIELAQAESDLPATQGVVIDRLVELENLRSRSVDRWEALSKELSERKRTTPISPQFAHQTLELERQAEEARRIHNDSENLLWEACVAAVRGGFDREAKACGCGDYVYGFLFP